MKYRFLRFPGGKPKAVTFSYDDGCRDDIRLSQTLNRYGIKCTLNINSGLLGKNTTDWHLTREEISEHLIRPGHEIALHGALHKAPGIVRPIDGIQDILSCRVALEAAFDRIIRGMAYPDCGVTHMADGNSYETIRNYLAELDIVYARALSDQSGSFSLPSDWYRWIPTAHHTDPKLLDMIDRFIAFDDSTAYCSDRRPKLFYFWGHSFEYERDGNWDLLETVCQTLGGQKNVWYATNMEIYDYVTAYRSLVFSADGRLVRNPTLLEVWFDLDGRLYSVKSGQALRIEE